MLISKRSLTIHGKNYNALDPIPDHILPPQRVQTLINVGYLAKADEGDVTSCANCERKFMKKTHNQKYCSKDCRKAN